MNKNNIIKLTLVAISIIAIGGLVLLVQQDELRESLGIKKHEHVDFKIMPTFDY